MCNSLWNVLLCNFVNKKQFLIGGAFIKPLENFNVLVFKQNDKT